MTDSAISEAMNELEQAVEAGEQAREIALVAQRLELDSLPTQALSNAISQQQLSELWGKTPEHAVKYRPGPGGKVMPYVPHGFVEFKLNKVFGGDWDIEPLPVFNGSVFHLQQAETTNAQNKKVVNWSVTVCCKMTVRVRHPESLAVVATITKTEFGSAAWYPENELGDALKSAESDALKRCGLRLGIALDMYYDDDRARADKQQQAEASRKMAEAMKEDAARKRRESAPATVPDIVLRVKETYGVQLKELASLLYGGATVSETMTRMTNDLKTLGAKEFWAVIVKACQPSNTVIDQPPTTEAT